MITERGSSQFQQRKANEMKLGAYYTDPGHCERICRLFSFSTEEETSVLEPSIGNGMAVKLATDALNNEKIRIFGVEINAEVAEQLQRDTLYEAVLKADFLKDVMITNSCFSFVFANPPYMNDYSFERSLGMKSERMEYQFLEKCTTYIKPHGILCWIIPYRIFIEDYYIGYMMSRYEILKVYKMDDKEFAKWGQVVIIAERRAYSLSGCLKEDRIKMQEALKLEDIPYLPYEVGDEEKIVVPPSAANKVVNFKPKVFDANQAEEWVKQHPEVVEPLNAHIRAKTGIKKSIGGDVYTPPREPSKASIALLAACGVGNGLVGSVEEKNLHLQRGSVTIEKKCVVDEKVGTNGTKSAVMTERSYSVTRQILIESDGTIRDITKKEDDAEEVS